MVILDRRCDMRNNEVKRYKGYTIRKEREGLYFIGGFMDSFSTWAEAKEAIDAAVAEDKALKDAEDYVRDVIGGYL